ncbi:radical SAM protein [Paucibacter sp. R3-3]|uniref:Radical SAM protein n=1 Tax=Roseateles agri TaxID=3098619 RepID=A0ABU5DR25_9BURK|nr:radical SAM protein [Paucibacter sp. R3-3]MDY0748768.1 radical SAM protein [Paucibacter sp. R3-3]
MLSILIGHSYFQQFDRKQAERAKPYPPLATLQVAALLRQQGHRVGLFDAMLAASEAEFEASLERDRPQLVLVYEDNYNFLTKMCLARMREACLAMIGMARERGARVIVAGSDASDAPEPYLQAGADVVLRGEGLTELQAMLPRLAARIDLPALQLIAGLPSASCLADGVVRRGEAPLLAYAEVPSRGEERPLEAEAAWDLVDVERYRRVWTQAHGRFSLNMASSKGCSFRCAWCAKPIWGRRYEQRDPVAVAAEMTLLRERFAPDHVWFADDIFGFRADWVQRFADALEARGGGVPFTIQIRPDLISEAMAQALARAGCQEAWLGAESGSQKVLDAMDKGTTVETIHLARARLREQGIRVGFFIQLGYLGEEGEDLLATRRLVEQARPDDVGVSVAYPLPGTRFFDEVQAQLRGKTHWDDSGDLAMMFEGTFGTAFYREARDLLHEQVRVSQLPSEARALAEPVLAGRWDALMARAQVHQEACLA